MVTPAVVQPQPPGQPRLRRGPEGLAASSTTDQDQPMVNRATQQILPPGSTFKLVTAAAALENGVVNDVDDKVKAGATLKFPGIRLHPAQRGRRQLRRQHDHLRAGAQRLVQRRLRRARPARSARRSWPSRPRSSASAPTRSPGIAAEPQPLHPPDTTLEPPQLAQSRHRPVRGRRDPAADGHGRGRHRQRRRRHEAVRRRHRPRAQPAGAREDRARAAQRGGERVDRRASCAR